MISVVAALVLAIVMTSFGYSDDCSFGHPLLSGQFLKSGGWPLYTGSTVYLYSRGYIYYICIVAAL